MDSDPVFTVGDRVGIVRELRLQIDVGGSDAQVEGLQLQLIWHCAERQIQIVGERSVLGVAQVSVTVRKGAIISFGQRSIMNVGAQFVQIGCQRRFEVVVVYFTVCNFDVAVGEFA